MTLLNNLTKDAYGGKKRFAVLVDPDKSGTASLKKLAAIAGKAGVDYFFFGGSLLMRGKGEEQISVLRDYSDIPVILFPGSSLQVFPNAHGILLLSLISGRNPEWFDVIVTDNMFGDIITDLAAMIQGGMGIAAGGNINPEGVSMFEPIGGSAPKYTGKNVINPLAAIGAGAMLLREIGEEKAAGAIESSIRTVVTTKIQDLAAGKMGYSTTEVGDLVVKHL